MDLKPIVQAIINAAGMKTVTALAQQTSLQTFINLYMSPVDATTSDLINRLGITIDSEVNPAPKPAYDFPPYNVIVAPPLDTDTNTTSFPTRGAGFMQLNNQINNLQKMLMLLTGQIRTKITEWDLSIYFQEKSTEVIENVDLVSLLYRIYQDNPSGYTDNRALAYGNLNTALSEARFETWNPTADPDLINWVPPCTPDELAAVTTPPPPIRRRFLWWHWSVPGPSWQSVAQAKFDAVTYTEIKINVDLGWGTWYPQYWQLFYTAGGGASTSLSAGEIEAESRKLSKRIMDKLLAMRTAKTRSIPAVEPPKDPVDTGLELESPLLYGRPYGKNLDPRSLQGYFKNLPPEIPKVAPKSSWAPGITYPEITAGYKYFPSLSGVSYLLNGWNSTYPYTTYTTETRQVVEEYEDNRGRTRKRTVNQSVQVPVENTGALTGYWPTATARLVYKEGSSNVIGKLLWPFSALFNIGPKTTPAVARLENISNISTFDSVLGGRSAPVILTAKDGSYICMATVTKRTETTAVSHRKKVLFIWITWNTYVDSDYYEVSLDDNTLFYRTASEDTFNTLALSPKPGFPLDIKGIYFSFPSRGLTGGQNLVTSGWSNTVSGTLIGKMFLTPAWMRPDGTSVTAPVKATLSYLNTTLLKSILPSLTTLATTLNSAATGGSSGFTALINSLPQSVRESSTIAEVRAFFTSSSNLATLSMLVGNISGSSAGTSLQSAINAIINSAGVTGYTVNNINAFINQYPGFIDLLSSPLLPTTLRHWLTLLYALRIESLKKRINKEDGTLYAASQAAISHLRIASTGDTPTPGSEYILSELEVVHKVTTVSLAERLKTSKTPTSTPTEKVKKVYVKVNYTSAGAIVRPPAGNYSLLSQEIIDSKTDQPVSFYITFTDTKNKKAPNIIKNVMTAINETKLIALMGNPKLSQLEILCGSRVLEDWWEIDIPVKMWPLATKYENSLRLIILYPDATIASIQSITGSSNSPIVDDITKMMPSQVSAKDLEKSKAKISG